MEEIDWLEENHHGGHRSLSEEGSSLGRSPREQNKVEYRDIAYKLSGVQKHE